MKVLVATDGSAGAIDAARAARGLLNDDAELVIVTVVEPLQDPQESAGGFEGPAFTEEEAEKWAEEAAVAGEAALEHTAEAMGESAEIRLVKGDDPARALCDLAEELDAAAIVVGTSEKGFLRRLLVGSVMNHLVHHAPCPVLVVRHGD